MREHNPNVNTRIQIHKFDANTSCVCECAPVPHYPGLINLKSLDSLPPKTFAPRQTQPHRRRRCCCFLLQRRCRGRCRRRHRSLCAPDSNVKKFAYGVHLIVFESVCIASIYHIHTYTMRVENQTRLLLLLPFQAQPGHGIHVEIERIYVYMYVRPHNTQTTSRSGRIYFESIKHHVIWNSHLLFSTLLYFEWQCFRLFGGTVDV